MKNNELGHETNVEKQIKFVENLNSSTRITQNKIMNSCFL